MIITSDYIKTLKPCEEGIIEFDEYHKDFKGSMGELLALNNLKYKHKTWLACKVIDYKILQQWSVECSEFVVDNYNKLYPDDTRVSDCIEATKKYLEGNLSLDELNKARSAAGSAARSARSARSAWSAWSAWYSAESAEPAMSAWSARFAAWSAEKEKEQEDINLSLLVALL